MYGYGSNYDYEGSPLNEFKNATQVRDFFKREEMRNAGGSTKSSSKNSKNAGKKVKGGKQQAGKQQAAGGSGPKGAKKKKLGASTSQFQTMNPMNAGAILSPIKGFPLYGDGYGGEQGHGGVGEMKDIQSYCEVEV